MSEDDRTLDGPDPQGAKILELMEALGAPEVERVLRRGPAALARQQAVLSEDEEASTLLSDDMADAERFSAMLESAFLWAAAGGEVTTEASRALASVLADLTGGLLPLEEVEALLTSYAEALSQEGYEARARSVAQALRDRALKEAAFMLAAGVALGEGKQAESDKNPSGVLAGVWGFSEEEAAALLEKVSGALSEGE